MAGGDPFMSGHVMPAAPTSFVIISGRLSGRGATNMDGMNEPLARVLVADDEVDLCNLLRRYLTEQGCLVRTVDSGAALDRLLARERFDVLVLDVMMQGEDGLSICRRLRAQRETIPILMLTARGDPVDRIIGLEMGADDYLPKPFSPRELLARIQAMVRRQRILGARPVDCTTETVLRFGGFMLDLERRHLERAGEALVLTSGEFALLRVLALNPGRPLGRERLIELSRGRDHDASERSIDVQVMRLRKLIENDPGQPCFIQTVWGVGYVFVPEGRRRSS